MRYDYLPGTILKDTTYGIEWIVEKKISGGVRIKVNRNGGPFMDATPESCRLTFMVQKSGNHSDAKK